MLVLSLAENPQSTARKLYPAFSLCENPRIAVYPALFSCRNPRSASNRSCVCFLFHSAVEMKTKGFRID